MERDSRTKYVEALDVLLKGEMARIFIERDFELLEEVARIAQMDAPKDLAVTDPALYVTLRAAITHYHLAGWTMMTPEKVVNCAESYTGKNSRS